MSEVARIPQFQQLLTEFRKGSKLSQSDLARRVDLSASYINRLESGDRLPSGPDLVLALARALDLSPAETDRLLISAGYARESDRLLAAGHPLVSLVARIVSDERVTPEQLEMLEVVAGKIDQQRRRAGEEAPGL
jgi:transcriptional regulator with XRE-family HTH domain